jgi:predicted ArsR family transcriptional regulator
VVVVSVEPDSKRRIVEFLKRRTSATVAEITEHLGVTSTAVRQHLDDLQNSGLVVRLAAVITGGRGRPRMPWALTDLASELFPDRHADLTVELISAIRDSVGEEGLDAVIATRTANQKAAYGSAVDRSRSSIAESVAALADIRSAEGYMAEVTAEGDDSLLLTEHHCPICDAAKSCQALCRDELDLFREVLGPDVTVERTSHVLSGDPRCAYRVTPVTIASP